MKEQQPNIRLSEPNINFIKVRVAPFYLLRSGSKCTHISKPAMGLFTGWGLKIRNEVPVAGGAEAPSVCWGKGGWAGSR